MRPASLIDIHAVGIPVADQDAALAFYVGTLGFEVRLDGAIAPGRRWIEVAPPGASTSLALEAVTTAPGPAPRATGIRFAVLDAAAEHAALEEHGIAVGDLLRWDGVPPMFVFDDPDGNRFVAVEVAP